MKKAPENESVKLEKTPNFPGLFGVLFIVFVGLIFINSGVFTVKEVTVQGNELVSAEDIILLARLNNYKNIFQVDSHRIKEAILQNPKIALVDVRTVFPKKILITVKERQPLCLLLYLDNLLIISDDSVIMGIKEENDPINLPIVTGIQLPKVKVGERVNQSQFQIALSILKTTDENLQQNISEVNISNFQLYIDLPNSNHTLKVELGSASQIEKKIYNLRAILSHTAPNELEKIDLRAPDLPTVIKFKPSPK